MLIPKPMTNGRQKYFESACERELCLSKYDVVAPFKISNQRRSVRILFLLSSSFSIPLAPTRSIGRPWNASFNFSFLILESRQDSLDGGSARRKAANNTGQHKQRIYADIHALNGIRTHDPRVRAGEDISYLRPRGHCDRQSLYYTTVKGIWKTEFFNMWGNKPSPSWNTYFVYNLWTMWSYSKL
jgi:hypothetical protein